MNNVYNENDAKTLREQSKEKLKELATPSFQQEFFSLIRSQHPLFYITLIEEVRFLTFVDEFCKAYGYKCFYWDSYRGLIDMDSKKSVVSNSETFVADPVSILEHIINETKGFSNNKSAIEKEKMEGVKGHIYLLLDFFRFIRPEPEIERRLKEISNSGIFVSTIITGPVYKTTEVLENLIPVVDFPYPNSNEIRSSLYTVVDGFKRFLHSLERETKEIEEELINAVSGLTIYEAQTAFSKSIVLHKKWDLDTILREKRQIISKSGELEYIEKKVPMSQIGGLKNLVEWIRKRKKCFSKSAEEYGLSKPKGLLAVGYPGAGKSLICKAVSSCWNMPLLRLDFGTLFNSYVGQSEANARKVIKLAEAVSPSILWIDEIEKAISGIRSSGRSDSGTTSRVLSIFLTWMQEKESSVFVVATANDHESIPPEFLRAGRFDEIFFVDLPNTNEREEIFKVLLEKNKLDYSKFDLNKLARSTDKFSGAEIEKSIENAKIEAFYDGERSVTDKDILTSISSVIPLAKVRDSDFTELKEWAESSGVLFANKKEEKDLSIDLNCKKEWDI